MVAILEAFQVSCERVCLANAEGVKGVHWVGLASQLCLCKGLRVPAGSPNLVVGTM